jgi:hypothetical protein
MPARYALTPHIDPQVCDDVDVGAIFRIATQNECCPWLTWLVFLAEFTPVCRLFTVVVPALGS